MLPSRWTRWVLLALCTIVGAAGGLMVAAKSHEAAGWETIPTQGRVADVVGGVGSPGYSAPQSGRVEFGVVEAETVGPAVGREAGRKAVNGSVAADQSRGSVSVPQSVASAMQRGILDINRASASEFDSLPGIGPTLAERVVQLRKQKGRFDSVEDLLEVKGIGPSKLGRLRPFAAVRDLGGESPGE